MNKLLMVGFPLSELASAPYVMDNGISSARGRKQVSEAKARVNLKGREVRARCRTDSLRAAAGRRNDRAVMPSWHLN